MNTTLRLPSGRKLRTATKRRYVLVYDGVDRGLGPSVEKRSDATNTLRRASFRHTIIIDTETGDVVR